MLNIFLDRDTRVVLRFYPNKNDNTLPSNRNNTVTRVRTLLGNRILISRNRRPIIRLSKRLTTTRMDLKRKLTNSGMFNLRRLRKRVINTKSQRTRNRLIISKNIQRTTILRIIKIMRRVIKSRMTRFTLNTINISPINSNPSLTSILPIMSRLIRQSRVLNNQSPSQRVLSSRAQRNRHNRQ